MAQNQTKPLSSATTAEGSDVDKTMADVRHVEAPNLTEDEHRLVTAYRNAGSSVRVSVDKILGLVSSSEAEEGRVSSSEAEEGQVTSSEAEEGQVSSSESEEGALPSEEVSKPVSGKRSHPFKDKAVTKKARVQAGPDTSEQGLDVSQSHLKTRRLDPKLSQSNHRVSFDFAHLVWPRSQPRCIVQINDGILIGDFGTNTKGGISPKLFLDPARMGSPRIGISFDCPGTHGPEVAATTWHLDDHLKGEWVVNKFVAPSISAVSPSDLSIYNPGVIKRCPRMDLQYLHYLGLELNPYLNGFFRKGDANLSKKSPENDALRSMFNAQDRYEVRVWFLTPPASRSHNFERNCLAAFTDMFAQRQIPLDRAQDKRGVLFKDFPKLPRQNPHAGPIPKVDQRTKFVPAASGSGTSHGAAPTNRVAGSGSKSGRTDHVRTFNKPVPAFGFQLPIAPSSSSGGKLAPETKRSELTAGTDQSPATESDTSLSAPQAPSEPMDIGPPPLTTDVRPSPSFIPDNLVGHSTSAMENPFEGDEDALSAFSSDDDRP